MNQSVSFFKPILFTDEIAQWLEPHPVFHHPGFRWSIDLEGYKNHVFGCKTASVSTLSALCHELGHALDFGANEFETRALKNGWRFDMPYIRFKGHILYRPRTAQASYREGRVVAIEQRLCEILTGEVLGAEFCGQRAFSMVKHLPDFFLVKQDEPRFKRMVMEAYAEFDWCKAIHDLRAWFEETFQLRHQRVSRDLRSLESGKAPELWTSSKP